MIFLVRSKPDFHDKGMLKHGLLNFQSCRGSSRLLWDMAAMMPQRLRLISYASWSANKQKGTSVDSRRVYTEKLAKSWIKSDWGLRERAKAVFCYVGLCVASADLSGKTSRILMLVDFLSSSLQGWFDEEVHEHADHDMIMICIFIEMKYLMIWCYVFRYWWYWYIYDC